LGEGGRTTGGRREEKNEEGTVRRREKQGGWTRGWTVEKGGGKRTERMEIEGSERRILVLVYT
jgi:hypothetical protein